MSQIIIYCCDLCGCALPKKQPWSNEPAKEGMIFELGYSRGGWGHRQTFISFKGEVCPDCFAEYEKIAEGFKRWRDARKDTKIPVVTIFHGTAGASDPMPDVREGEPQSERRGEAVLPALPCVSRG